MPPPGRRLHQRQERHPCRRGVWGAQAEFRGSAILGQGLLRLHSWSRRGDDPDLNQAAGAGALGVVGPLALNATVRSYSKLGSRERSPSAALSGAHHEAPGFAGGYLLYTDSRLQYYFRNAVSQSIFILPRMRRCIYV